ncbi:type II secretion system F family protein [Streptomyces sp. NBC_00094]|uniref:type II secretion system F family protein n=1 Tax=Streptomyces sp. NBC_00094 TaxID=2903620 RepID=UPI002254DD43|nr:type II secretion system F family protein [Streptomyces sp. NBC_00094]MCX5391570.1 type II secretion system F family protein [Streptomyces sp. NBC_00094]
MWCRCGPWGRGRRSSARGSSCGGWSSGGEGGAGHGWCSRGGVPEGRDEREGRRAWWAAAARRWALVRKRRAWLCLPVAGVVALWGGSPLPLLAGAVAVPLVARRLRAAERRKEQEARAERVVALCGAVSGELRAGWQPAQALSFAARQTGALGDEEAVVLAAARFGGDVPEALRRAAHQGGADGLAGLAACWQVAVDGGAGLAAGLDRLEAALREHREQRERLRAELAGAWATVTVLAVLPAAGLAMGAALGADPLRVLLHTPAGLGCLAVGGALEAAGLWWAARIVRGGERG